ncbi:glycogen debranching N-terminal domain-containing protein [Pseudarthrobacter sp. NPDC080039]|uniref:glycogen debranching N-terminal domain-containing protein n=1 Tax=unclassified Pseudarthrobacter TaxID=2647000 RepID=UPI00344D8F53
MSHQPTLHESNIAVAAPTQVISTRAGLVGAAADASGIYHGELRALRRLELCIEGSTDFIGSHGAGSNTERYRYIVRNIGEPTQDPALLVTRTRVLRPGHVTDTYSLANTGLKPLTVHATLHLATDFASLADIKAERGTSDAEPTNAGHITSWTHPRITVRATTPFPPATSTKLVLPPGTTHTLKVGVDIEDREVPLFLPVTDPAKHFPAGPSTAGEHPEDRTLEQSLNDLRGLLLADSAAPEDVFLAAGSPWYCTLFGRDALWAARFTLSLGTGTAMGTLRTLARRQALHENPATDARPGKILHVAREKDRVLTGGVVLPAVYFGTVDATPLWISLLHDAWQHGAPEEDIAALLPTMRRCLEWMASTPDKDGFLRYKDTTGRGLANQGWKDSTDGIRDHDGRPAEGPLALCEVQAYAHAAALNAATLMRRFNTGDPDRWEQYAADLAHAFRKAFWIESTHGIHPAVALESDGRPVTALTSNIGHVLGTGLCTAEEATEIADRLMNPVLDSGYGLRTMASDTAGYNPLGYHTGSVWTHDTIIAATGLAREGKPHQAARLAQGIMDAAQAFNHRIPELHGGYPASEGPPAPYAAACRPQAWSAAAIIAAIPLLNGQTKKPEYSHPHHYIP